MAYFLRVEGQNGIPLLSKQFDKELGHHVNHLGFFSRTERLDMSLGYQATSSRH